MMDNGRIHRNMGRTVDWSIVICWLMLFLVGWLAIYASIHSTEPSSIFDMSARSGKQLMWLGISAVAAILILFVFPANLWEVVSVPAYLVVVVLLVGVLLFGAEVNGSKSWFQVGPIAFQPCELSKITTSLLLAHFLRSQSFKMTRWRDLLTIVAVVGIPVLIILAEGETGTLLVYFGYLFVLYREGMSGWWLAVLGAIVALFIVTIKSPLWVAFLVLALMLLAYFLLVRGEARSYAGKRDLAIALIIGAIVGTALIFSTDFVFDSVLRPHQRLRIEVLLGIKEDPMGAGYNVNQSMIAIGSGGLFGKGYLQGTQTAYGFVPEQSTDFIFCTIGEEFGFVGCLFVILLYAFLIWRILQNAESSREPYIRIYGYCLASCLFMHLIINVGMTIGLMPVIGIPLPFISYGGSSLLSFTVMLFIFLALVKQEKRYF